MRPNPRENPDDAYAAFMEMDNSEWVGLLFSIMKGGVLTLSEHEGFIRALEARRDDPD